MFLAHIKHSFAAAFFPRLSEWWAAGTLFALGWMLFRNPDLMSSAKTQAYRLMLMIAAQETWALFITFFAGVRLLILLINGAWRKSPHLRSVFAFLSCFFWTQIALSFAPTFGFALIFAGAFLTLDLVNSIRAAGDARTIDSAYAKGRPAGGQD